MSAAGEQLYCASLIYVSFLLLLLPFTIIIIICFASIIKLNLQILLLLLFPIAPGWGDKRAAVGLNNTIIATSPI